MVTGLCAWACSLRLRETFSNGETDSVVLATSLRAYLLMLASRLLPVAKGRSWPILARHEAQKTTLCRLFIRQCIMPCELQYKIASLCVFSKRHVLCMDKYFFWESDLYVVHALCKCEVVSKLV